MSDINRIKPYLTAVNGWLLEHTLRNPKRTEGYHAPSDTERKILRELCCMVHYSPEMREHLGAKLSTYIDSKNVEQRKYHETRNEKYSPLYVKDNWMDSFHAFMALNPPPDMSSLQSAAQELLKLQYSVLDGVKPDGLIPHNNHVIAPAIHLESTTGKMPEPFGLTRPAKGDPTVFIFPGHEDYFSIAGKEYGITREQHYLKARTSYHHILREILSHQAPITAALVLRYPTRYERPHMLFEGKNGEGAFSEDACAFVDRFLLPIISARDSNGSFYKLENITPALEALSKITLIGYCLGGAKIEEIEDVLLHYTRTLGYSETEKVALFNSLGALTLAYEPPAQKPHMIPRICGTLEADHETFRPRNWPRRQFTHTASHQGLKYAHAGSQLLITGIDRPEVPLAYSVLHGRFFSLYEEDTNPAHIRDLFVDRDTAARVSPHLSQHFLRLPETVERNGGRYRINQTSIVASPMRGALDALIEAGRNGPRNGEAVVQEIVTTHLSHEGLIQARKRMKQGNEEFMQYIRQPSGRTNSL